ncbi:hypothetical protein GGR52DRAFT_58236 [Hypoxylon sp. FL1284]|nr:hypothetical protein GGR52DRAFT_58236 [Hypoxylon sp. FL1284]
MSRCGARGRHRNTALKPLKIPAKVPEEAEAKSASFVPSQQYCLSPISASQRPSLSEPISPSGFATDTETDVNVETRTLVSDAGIDQAELTVTETHLSDFSNYLGISQGGDDDDASVTVVDSDAFPRASFVEDAYGWDAELGRQAKCGFGRTSSACSCQYQCGKVDGGKRGLLQRVFSAPARRASAGL